MPIISNSKLPSFKRLKDDGEIILSKTRANNQEIRELHIGLLNMMPDAALEITERQFFRLIGNSNQIAQFYLHPFSLPSIIREKNFQQHIDKYYKTFDEIKENGLDALIISGANVENPELANAPFFEELKQVINWSYKNVTSTLCSCLATHAAMEVLYQQKRSAIGKEYWGVFSHTVINRSHPLMNGVDTIFNVPHSRYNEITARQFISAGTKILVQSEVGVHLALSSDLLRMVFFQGHPEYDTISLLKEYRREIANFLAKKCNYPDFPENYFDKQAEAILLEFKQNLLNGKMHIEDFPEELLAKTLNNTWVSVSGSIINNWIGLVYQTTGVDIKQPFMHGLDADNPLNLCK